jgi:hypothetical protein
MIRERSLRNHGFYLYFVSGRDLLAQHELVTADGHRGIIGVGLNNVDDLGQELVDHRFADLVHSDAESLAETAVNGALNRWLKKRNCFNNRNRKGYDNFYFNCA